MIHYLHCDKCKKKLGTYLYGPGGIEEKARIEFNKNTFILPDIICNDCIDFLEPKEPLIHGEI